MKNLITIWLMASGLNGLCQDNSLSTGPWKLEKDECGVQVFSRWKDAGPDRKAKQRRIQMIVDSSMPAVIATIKDDHLAGNWINRAKQYYNFDLTDESNWYTYLELGIPMPFKNQDLVTKNHLFRDSNAGIIRIEISSDNNKLPKKANIDRIVGFEGSWILTPLNEGKIKIEYLSFTGQKPRLPAWLTEPLVVYGLWKTLTDMREVIIEKNKSMAKLY